MSVGRNNDLVVCRHDAVSLLKAHPRTSEPPGDGGDPGPGIADPSPTRIVLRLDVAHAITSTDSVQVQHSLDSSRRHVSCGPILASYS